ncbi:uncharacterized protein METZ01_LOCUS373350, partial [marine metagenome]
LSWRFTTGWFRRPAHWFLRPLSCRLALGVWHNDWVYDLVLLPSGSGDPSPDVQFPKSVGLFPVL